MKNFLNRFNDIEHITKMLKVTNFNNKLLIPIKILKKISSNKYKLLIGNKEISTTSYIDLTEGMKYWAELSDSKEGGIKLSSLKQQPDLLQIDKFPLSFELESIPKILKLNDPAQYMKTIILEALSDSDNKFEFEFLINLLSSIEQGVLTIPFTYNEKYNFVQLLPTKNILSFFITTNNLGTIKGNIINNKDNSSININTFFQNGYKYLSLELKKILSNDFAEININLEEQIETLFSFRQSTSFSI